MIDGADRAKVTRDEKSQALKKVEDIWTTEKVKELLGHMYNSSALFWKEMRRLSIACQNGGLRFEVFRGYLLRAQVDRISGHGRGKTSKNSLEPADITKALNKIRAGDPWSVNADELAGINRGTNLQGLICATNDDTGVGVQIPPSSERGSPPEEDDEEEGVVSPRQLRDRGKVQYADDVPSDTEEEVGDENYARGGHDFNDTYSVSEDDKNATDDEDLTAVESAVEEDEGETRVSRPRRGKKVGERHPCKCKANILASFIS